MALSYEEVPFHRGKSRRQRLEAFRALTGADADRTGEVKTASTAETAIAPGLLDMIQGRGTLVRYAVMDRGYDSEAMHGACEARGIHPIISLRQTPSVKAGKHLPRECEHGSWTFAGSDAKRGAAKWRCPTGECAVKFEWVKADRLHPLVPRTTERFKSLYHQRGAVEREFGRLKHEWSCCPCVCAAWSGCGCTPT